MLYYTHIYSTTSTTTTSEVDHHVPGNVTLSLETLATNITLELPQASVSEGVAVESTNGSEFLATLLTLVIPDANVSGHVW
ncbi:hypothetical protein E2C01_088807 [Portunus trituberculatus]|uniref:Uncharacterized protein n=1 Tax=Portunus trituberculatus TaxID=210409 RepID=A0A5B7JFN6_PORTR|nr:hypothetical protein [Portunus trituberculatus]